MGTIAQKVQWTWDCKRDIEQALLERGIALPQDFRDFGDAIRSIGRKPYDSEVEYLETSGTQYIDTGVAVSDPSTIAIEADEDVAQPLGFTHQNVQSGTWLSRYAPPAATQTLYIYYKNYNNRTTAPATETRKVARWDGSSGYYENGTSLVSFVASIDSDSIDGRNWLYGAVWDFNANAVDSRQSRAGKIYGLKVEVSGVLVRDFIPVRKNGVGYLYDRVSKTLFGNAGTGAFTYGEDVREVEYIESTGTQYIDTGVLKEPNTIVSARIYSAFPEQQQFFGTFAAQRFSIQVNTNLRAYPYAGTGISTYFTTTKDEWHDYTVDSGTGTYTFDGTPGSIAGATSFSTTIPIFVFCRNQNGVANTLSAFRLASLKIWHGSTLVRDFIPYRIGNKGCLYDKVSGKFFTNAGTGDFTAGPDALNQTTTSKAVYDAKVEYIESTGTQFIDTGIVPDGKGTSVECVFSNSVDGNFSPILWTRGVNATDRAFCFEVEQRQQARWDYADYDGAIQMANAVPLNERVTLTIKDGTATVNGVQMTRASKEFTGAGPMILCNFCNYVNGERQMVSANANPVRIYSFKVFSDGLLVRDFQPVRKDGRGCLYDLVTGRLFENAGTGVFKYGEDVVDLPADTEMLYDSEVEWIAPAGDNTSDSTAWIDAGYVPTTTAHAKAEFSITNIYPEKAYFVFGRQVHNANSRFQIGRSNNTSTPLDIGIGSTYKDFSASSGDFVVELDLSSGTSTVNGVVTTGYVVSASGLGTSGTRVFRRDDASAESSGLRSGVVRLKRLQFSNGSTLIRDFIPVRKNGVGYLFDRVGRKLYGNAGTGAFAYGGDK